MNAEEYQVYLNENYPNRPICCFCGNQTDCPFGNNPEPIAKKGKCCGKCNNAVVFVRMGLIPLNYAKKHKKELPLVCDLAMTELKKH